MVSPLGRVRFASRAAAGLFGCQTEDWPDREFGLLFVAGATAERAIVCCNSKKIFVEIQMVQTVWLGEPVCVAFWRDISRRTL